MKWGYPLFQCGVTLTEMLVVVAISAILLGIGVPGFQQVYADIRLSSRANELSAALFMARSEAIRRNLRISLCKSEDTSATPPTCDESAGWNEGWVLFVDNVHLAGNELGVLDGEDTVIKVFDAQGAGTLSGGTNYARGISYLPSGVSSGIKAGGVAGLPNGTFTVCLAGQSRKLIINSTGRVRVESATCS
jgi:type IV fimbrial biogenesis protein FimT